MKELSPSVPVPWLLLHGLTGTPQELAPLAEHFTREQVPVRMPLLPGHGTSLRELARSRPGEWLKCVEDSFAELHAQSQQVAVAGCSLGAVLALHLAIANPTAISRLVLFSPPLCLRSWKKEMLAQGLSRLPDRLLDRVGTIAKSPLKKKMLEIPHQAYERHSLGAVARMIQIRSQVMQHVSQVCCPVLLMIDPEDYNVHPRVITTLASSLAGKLSVRTFSDGGHELLLGRRRGDVLVELRAWIKNTDLSIKQTHQ